MPDQINFLLSLLPYALVALIFLLIGLAKETIVKSIKAVAHYIAESARGQLSDSRFEKKYLNWLIGDTRNITLIGVLPAQEERRPQLHQLFVLPRLLFRQRRVEPQDPDRTQESITPWPTLELTSQPLIREEERSLPLSEALARNERIAILGEPGAGKSTLQRFLALAFAQGLQNHRSLLKDSLNWNEEPLLPLFIPLRLFAESPKRVAEFMEDYVRDQTHGELSAPPGYFARQLDRARCILLLDALDEVSKTEDNQRVVTAINTMSSEKRRNRFVVTSRIVGWRDILASDFPRFYVRPFDKQQTEEFVNKWYDAVELNAVGGPETEDQARLRVRHASDRALELSKAITANDRLGRLAENPLLLSVMAMVHREDMVLPRERAKLYERCTELLLHRWDEGRGIEDKGTTGLTLSQKQVLMRHVAYKMHIKGMRQIPRQELEGLIAEILPSMSQDATRAKDFLGWLERRSGLVADGGEPTFAHLAFQEYFAAQAIVADKHKLKRLLQLDCLFADWWAEVVLLYAGLIDDATGFVEKVYGPEDDVFNSRLILAGQCIAQATRVQPSLKGQIIDKLKATILSTPYSSALGRTVQVLVEIGGQSITQWALEISCDSSLGLNVRWSLAGVLGELGDKSIVPRLLEMLGDEKLDSPVRWRLAGVLGKLGDKSIVPRLLGMLPSDPYINAELYLSVISALANNGDRTTLPTLIALLSDTALDRFSARRALTEQITRLGNDEHTVSSLVSMLPFSDMPDEVYTLLYSVSRRVGVRVLEMDSEYRIERINQQPTQNVGNVDAVA